MNIYDVDISLIDTETGELLLDTKLSDITLSSESSTNYLSRWLACFVRGCCKGNNLSLEFNAKLKAF